MANTNGNSNTLTPEATATMLYQAGFSFIPIKIDGTKAPCVKWKPFQSERPTVKQIEGWYGGDKKRGVSIVMGKISGNAEMLELERRDMPLENFPRQSAPKWERCNWKSGQFSGHKSGHKGRE